jgi:hypothetical protein
MVTIPTKELRVVRMTARMLVFTDKKGQEYFASKRVANEILSESVDEVFVISQNFFSHGRSLEECKRQSMLMLATPSCW